MTFRAKPAVKRTHRPNWESDARRTIYLNLAFGAVIVLALLILGGAAAANYYGQHLAQAASVNGVGINIDDVHRRIAIDTFRLDESEFRLQQLVNQGRIDANSASQQRSQMEQSRSSISTGALDEIIDDQLKSQLASKQGITVTDQQVNDSLQKEATTAGAIHAWEIAIKPALSKDATAPTDAQKAAAKVTADYVLKTLKNGGDFPTIAKAQSSDSSASNGGDLGFLTVGDTSLDPAFEKALFALPVNGTTDIVTGADGTLRIGRVTKIVPEVVDANYQQKITQAGVSLDAYKAVLRASLVDDALKTKIESGLIDTPNVERHVLQIKLDKPQSGNTTGDEVKVRHILISPKNDPQGATSLPQTDPAWIIAKNTAEDIYQQLQKDPSPANFQAIAKAKSDDKGSGAQGGDLPYETQDALTTNFANAIFQPNLKPNQILAPIQTEYGWHIIQFIDRRRPAAVRIQTIASVLGNGTQKGADFATEAKQGDGPEASKGGDIGWVAHWQLPKELEDPIFKTPVGQISGVINASDGYYLFKIVAEETRKADAGDQTTAIKANAYTNWYDAQKAGANIQKDPNFTPPSS